MGRELTRAVKAYYEKRGMKFPDADSAMLFLVSEVGELADAIVDQRPGWTRNHPDKERNLADEIGDVLMMLTATAIAYDIDPFEAMLDKFQRKGYDIRKELEIQK
jgi:NTP pyrophosphatase (non-canonical NTP hydrolase)